MVSGQQYASAALYRRERPGTHCTGGWVGPRAGCGRAENLVPTGIRSRTVQPIAQSLYLLSYPAQNWSTVLDQIYFQYDDKHLQHTKGIAMVTPTSGVLLEIYLQLKKNIRMYL